MKRNAIAFVAVAAILSGLVFLNNLQPDRRTPEQIEASEKMEETLEEANEMEAQYAQNEEGTESDAEAMMRTRLDPETPLPEVPDIEMTENTQRYLFETTEGTWVLDVYPEWAPIGAAHFEEAVNAGVYNGAGIFRVIPDFVIQFGIPGDPFLAQEWEQRNIQDEPVKVPNTEGTVTYAKSKAPNSRTTQLFVNLGDNRQLDQMGFAPFGKVVHGMDVVKAINAEYREKPDQMMLRRMGNAYLRNNFPRLDYVQRVTKIADTTDGGEG